MKRICAFGVAFSTLLLGSSLIGCVVHETNAPPPPDPVSPAPAPAPAPPPAAAAPAPPAAVTPATPAAPAPAAPAAGAKHPYYIHALSDLRDARANLERKGGDRQMKWDEHDAVIAIDRALHDIKEAAIDDGKNVDDHVPIDAHEPRAGRLHKAMAALRAARADVEKEEDNAFANGLRTRAIHSIDEAIHFTEAGIQAAAQAS